MCGKLGLICILLTQLIVSFADKQWINNKIGCWYETTSGSGRPRRLYITGARSDHKAWYLTYYPTPYYHSDAGLFMLPPPLDPHATFSAWSAVLSAGSYMTDENIRRQKWTCRGDAGYYGRGILRSVATYIDRAIEMAAKESESESGRTLIGTRRD